MALVTWISELPPWAWVVGACALSSIALLWAVTEE